MGAKYTNQSISGYNASPPPDDGSTTANNKITWNSTIKGKLADPIKTLTEAVNTALVSFTDFSTTVANSNYTTIASDHMKTIEASGTTTILLMDAVSAGSGYIVGVCNVGVSYITVDCATGSDTINGSTASLTLGPNSCLFFKTSGVTTGYKIIGAYQDYSAPYLCPEQYGAAATFASGTDDTSFVNACFSAAQSAGKSVALRRIYNVTNITFGSQSTCSQSTSPTGMFGTGTQTGFIAKSGATGTLLQAWSIAGVVWENFICDANNETGITKVIDTEWKPGTGPDSQNRFNNVWVQKYYATGWHNRNNNQSPMYGCVVRLPVGANQTAFDCQASGGQIVMENCEWLSGILDLCCQNANLPGCQSGGIRLNKNQTGDNVINLAGGYLYSNTTAAAMIWDNSAATSGHLSLGIVAEGTLFGAVNANDAIFDIGIAGRIELNECVADTAVNWKLLGSNAVNKATGSSVIRLSGFASTGGGTPTLTGKTGILVEKDNIITAGTTSTEYAQVQSWTGGFNTSGGDFVIGAGGSVVSKYSLNGKMCNLWYLITVGSSGVTFGTGEYRITLPFTSDASVYGHGNVVLNHSGTNYLMTAQTYKSNTVANILIASASGSFDPTHPVTLAVNDQIWITMTYPIA